MYTLPNGAKFHLGATFGTPIVVTAATNALQAVLSAAAHGLAAKAEFIFKSGWEDANDRVFRVANPTTGNFEVEGLDTTSTSLFEAGGGVGTIIPILSWVEIQQVLNPSTSGGDPKFATVEPLARKNAIQIPAGFNPMALTIPIGDDPSLLGYKALKTASDGSELRPLRVRKPGANNSGSVTYFYGYPYLNEVSSMTKDQVDTVTAGMTIQGKPTRYATS
jgi:hypothetical protein